MRFLKIVSILVLVRAYELLLFAHSESVLVTSEQSTVLSVDNLNNHDKSGKEADTVIDIVLRLFCSDLLHSYNLILYGGNKSGILNTQKYIAQHPLYSQLITATVITDDDRVRKTRSMGLDASFKNVLISCLRSFHIEHKIIFIIQPSSIEETMEILTEINSFYETTPSKSFTVFFFISWTFKTSSEQNKLEAYSKGGRGHSYNEILNSLKSSVLIAPIDCHLYILSSEIDSGHSSFQEGTGWIMWEFFKIYGKNIYEPVLFSPDEFLQLFRRRKNFRGQAVRALVEGDITAPLLTSFNEINGSLQLRGGISYGFLQPMSEVLNFTIEIVNGTGWIAQDSEMNLIGMGKQLLDNEGDIVLSLSEMVLFRNAFLAASHPTTEFKVNAYFQQPPPGLYRDIYVQAFSPGLWALMSATWIAIITCLLLFTSIKKWLSQDSCAKEDQMIAEDALCWAVGAACQTGWHYTPKSTSLKIIFICGLVSGLVYYTAYSASIISIFSVEMQNFKSLSELVRQGFKLYGYRHSLTGQYHVETQAKSDGDCFNSRLIDVTPALKKIQESRTAYVTSMEFFFHKAVVQNNSYTGFCKFLTKLPQYVDRQYNAWFFRKFDPLRKFLNSQLTRWREPGLIFRTNMDHARTLPAPCDPKKKEAIPLEIQDVRSAFIILAAGFVLSICALVFEIVLHAKRNDLKVIWPESNCCCSCHRGGSTA